MDQGEFYPAVNAMLESLGWANTKLYKPSKSTLFVDPDITSVKIWIQTLQYAFPDNVGRESMAEYLVKAVLDLQDEPDVGRSVADMVEAITNDRNLVNKGADLILDNLLSPIFNKGRARGSSKKATEQPTESVIREQTKFRYLLTARDSAPGGTPIMPLRCPLTGRVHRQKNGVPAGELPVRLEAAHIMPHSVAGKPAVKQFILAFSGGTVTENLIGKAGINSAYNGMMMQHDAHQDYDGLLWSIEPSSLEVGINTTYKAVQHLRDGMNLSFPMGWAGSKVLEFGGVPADRPHPAICKLQNAVAMVFMGIGAPVETGPEDDWDEFVFTDEEDETMG